MNITTHKFNHGWKRYHNASRDISELTCLELHSYHNLAKNQVEEIIGYFVLTFIIILCIVFGTIV